MNRISLSFDIQLITLICEPAPDPYMNKGLFNFILLLLLLTACSSEHLASNNTELAELNIDGILLDQAFDPTITDYTASTGFLVRSIKLNLQTENPDATVTVNGEPYQQTRPLLLAEGDNTFSIVVTAADSKTTRTYNLLINRAAAGDLIEDSFIKSINTGANDNFGISVVIEGNLMAIGAPGEDSNSTGVNSVENDDGSADDSGAVYVYVREDGFWYPEAYIKADTATAGDRFGSQLALSGNTLAVSAIGDSSVATQSGAVYVFVRDELGEWSQQAKLKADNAGADDWFGYSLALSGDRIAVGAPFEDGDADGVNKASNDDAANTGAVYVFERDETDSWSQTTYIKAANSDAGDRFGNALALQDNLLAVGAPLEDSQSTGVNSTPDNNGVANGAVYLFAADDNGSWSQTAYLKSGNNRDNDFFGSSLALSDMRLAVGAPGDDNTSFGVNPPLSFSASNTASGAVYVFEQDNAGAWSQQAYIKAALTGSSNEQDLFGITVALSGASLAVGAKDDSSVGGVNPAVVDESAKDAGAVYLFQADASGDWAQTHFIKASNADTGSGAFDNFGFSLALSGETLLVGAPFEDSNKVFGDTALPDDNTRQDAGAAYLFR